MFNWLKSTKDGASDQKKQLRSSKASGVDDGRSQRLREEIERYRDVENVHDLPGIYHLWSNRFVLPKLQAVGFEDLDGFLIDFLQRASEDSPGECTEIASLGAGNCDLEIRLAEMLLGEQAGDFRFHCYEVNPHMLARAKQQVRNTALEERFVFQECNLDEWRADHPLDACLANHSLHHFANLETIFDEVRHALHPTGVFLVNDMIGRNGHMRWPEALGFVIEIWQHLPDRYKFNHQLDRLEPDFVNWDCSREGNEGIRAQDILPLLMENFHFEVFIAFANIIDVFVDRSFGHNFDPEDEDDRDLIRRIAELDERNLDRGIVKPTHLLAAMRTEPVDDPQYYKHWTPEFCVRVPEPLPF